MEEKERRRTGILNPASFLRDDFALRMTPLDFFLQIQWLKSLKLREIIIAEGKLMTGPMGWWFLVSTRLEVVLPWGQPGKRISAAL